MTNVPDRVQRMTLVDLVSAAEAAGWEVDYTTNVHLTRASKDAVLVLVETFDKNGFPHLYKNDTGRDELVEVGGNLGDAIECLTIGDVLDAAERVWQRPYSDEV